MTDADKSAKEAELKGILKKDGDPKKAPSGPITIDAPPEDPNKPKKILTREDTKHHVMDGVEWPEGEEKPRALNVAKPKGSIQKGAVKKAASGQDSAAAPAEAPPAPAAAQPAKAAGEKKKSGTCTLL